MGLDPLAELRAMCGNAGVGLRLNRNRRQYVSLRRRRDGTWWLSVHDALLAQVAAMADIHRFVIQRGRGAFPALREAMDALWRSQGERPMDPAECQALAGLPTVGETLVLDKEAEALRQHYFPALDAIPVRWGRDQPHRRLRAIRFGCYRPLPTPQIRLHPRLRRPWVACVFFEHVLHHELCHHALARQGVRRRHGARFHSIERGYEHYALARRWERCFLPRLLAQEDLTPRSTPIGLEVTSCRHRGCAAPSTTSAPMALNVLDPAGPAV